MEYVIFKYKNNKRENKSFCLNILCSNWSNKWFDNMFLNSYRLFSASKQLKIDDYRLLITMRIFVDELNGLKNNYLIDFGDAELQWNVSAKHSFRTSY